MNKDKIRLGWPSNLNIGKLEARVETNSTEMEQQLAELFKVSDKINKVSEKKCCVNDFT